MDLVLSSGEPILRRHIADRAVQSHCVVVIHVDLNQAARIVQRQRGQLRGWAELTDILVYTGAGTRVVTTLAGYGWLGVGWDPI
jgi:hypothetical protein